MFKTLRGRMALLTGGLMLIMMVLLGAFLYASLRFQLLRTLDDGLRLNASQMLVTVENENGHLLFAQGDVGNPPIPNEDDLVRLVGTDGMVLDVRGHGNVPVPPGSLMGNGGLYTVAAGPSTQAGEATGEHENQYPPAQYRLISIPVVIEGKTVAYLQVARSLESVNNALATLLVLLLIGTPFTLLLAMAGGYWLAGRTLAPIEQLRQEAAAISAHTMGQRRRLGDHLPNDEVGRLARTFDDMLARLDAVFQQQRRFTADASHELRTPLSIIRGEIDVALERPRTPTMYVQVLTSIRAEAERMSRLVADLLWLSRSDNRQLSLQVEPLDLAELLEALVEQLAGAAETAGVHLKLAMSPPIPLCGDMDRLLQLFLNLLDNAITYAPGSTVTVRVHPEPHTVRVEVADTGPGIPAEHLPHLFERFYRVDPARSREQGGSGLGLAIAQEIAQAHGGHIQVSSILHAGTTFTVTLPRMAPGCPQGLLP